MISVKLNDTAFVHAGMLRVGDRLILTGFGSLG